MNRYAIYRKSKRAKDLELLQWPVLGANAAEALAAVLAERKTFGEPVKRLRVFGPYAPGVQPLARISHYGKRRPL